MKEHGLIVATSGVQAILEGRKTQTRRVIKPQPCYEDGLYDQGWLWEGLFHNNEADLKQLIPLSGKCPYGQVGDRLWVKETWVEDPMHAGEALYKADGNPLVDEALRYHQISWRSPRFMFRKDSRITLEITGVRVERLQEITLIGAEAEGFALAGFEQGCSACDTKNHSYYGGIIHFAEYWDSLNAKRGYSWEANPWVWVIEFRRL